VFHLGKLLSLPTNIRLGCKGLPKTNTLAYLEYSLFTEVKSFITFSRLQNILKLKIIRISLFKLFRIPDHNQRSAGHKGGGPGSGGRAPLVLPGGADHHHDRKFSGFAARKSPRFPHFRLPTLLPNYLRRQVQ